jgi:phage head maturation protease
MSTTLIFEHVAAVFAFDQQRRTMTGVVVPWNKVGRHANGQKWRFNRGALKYGHEKYIRLNDSHVQSARLGRAIAAQDTDEGLVMTFQLYEGAAGDRALALAANGSRTGFSMEIEFDEADSTPDPDNPGVRLVDMANLTGVAFVEDPAFTESRLISVRASYHEGAGMPEPTTPPVPGPTPVPTPDAPPTNPNPTPPTPPASVSFSTEQLTAWMQATLAGMQPVAAPPVRPVVDPTHTPPATVTEPEPYRFDRAGNLLPAAHDFGRDVIVGLRDNDAAARERALAFVQAQFDVVTTNVNELNPTRNRPDMYVDQRSFRYPIWEAINKGTLSDITPFTFPKFSSSGSLVAAHTEGTEPSSGTFVTTLDTVTPTALSGKVKISRETWDQGGNPQVGNLIWRQMVKGWFEGLEAAAVSLLDTASPTQIDLSGTPGLADDDLDQALTQALARLQFIRGGFSMDTAFTQVDLFTALVGASGADGRRLYPALGPANANGTVRGRWAGVDVNGIGFLPAWALAATGTVAASSYLFDRDSVWGWASAPQRLTIDQIEVANVYIGIWGYKAGVISDINGVREIVYDPA